LLAIMVAIAAPRCSFHSRSHMTIATALAAALTPTNVAGDPATDAISGFASPPPPRSTRGGPFHRARRGGERRRRDDGCGHCRHRRQAVGGLRRGARRGGCEKSEEKNRETSPL
jgi:hypothetical protein